MRLRPEDDILRDSAPRMTAARRGLGLNGLVAGTEVLGDGGWTPVEGLREGDRLPSFDGGSAPVTAITRRWFGASVAHYWPNGLVLVPEDALGEHPAYYLLPGQQLVLSTDLALRHFDDPLTLVPAAALVGLNGIQRALPVDGIELVELRFPADTMIEIAGGTWVRSAAGGAATIAGAGDAVCAVGRGPRAA